MTNNIFFVIIYIIGESMKNNKKEANTLKNKIKQIRKALNKKINKQGFTLVELLATILVLAIVVSITMYVAINVINSAKQKTYEVTKVNITDNANNYLLENSDRLFFIPATDKVEYQCVTVKNLIELDYLDSGVTKSKVAENQTVNENDYIYVERNIKTKAVVKSIYAGTSDTYTNVCNVASSVGGKIQFISVPDVNVWSKSKEITIYYTLRNLSNMGSISDYHYRYNFASVNKDSTFDSLTATQTLTVTSNGTLYADIPDVTSGSLSITKIDRQGPVIALAADPSGNVAKSTTVRIKVTDNQSGVNYRSFTNDDIEVTIGGVKVTDYNLTIKDKTNEIVNYNLLIRDTTNNGNVIIKVKGNSVFDNIENGNGEVSLTPKIRFDNIKPVATLESTNKIKQTSQKITLKCSDETDQIASYYYGTTAPSANTIYVTTATDLTALKSNTGKVVTITSANDYYLVCKDAAGNVSDTAQVSINSYKVNNVLLTISGKYNEYTSANYAQVSAATYLAKKGTELVLADIYTVPTGSNAKKFKGYSTGNAGTTAATLAKTKISLTSNGVYTMWFNRNYVYLNFDMNEGSLALAHGASYGTSGTLITHNDSVNVQSIRYGGNLNLSYSYGLANYNNSDGINIERSGYLAKPQQEWKKEDGTTFDQDEKSYDAIKFCDAKNDDCTTKLLVNWVPVVDKPTAAYCKSLTYTGSSQTLVNSAATGFEWTGKTAGTNAGNYTVTAKLASGYMWSDKKTDNVTITCSIAKKPITITAKDQTITYGGSISTGTSYVTAATLISGHTLSAIILTPSTTDATTSGKITPSKATIKSGSTDVTSNYNITYNPGNLTINVKVLNVPKTPNDKTYTGSEQTSGIVCPTGSTASGTQKATVAGSYKQTCTLSSTTNYKWDDDTTKAKDITWKIAKKPITITAKDQTINYGGSISTGTGQITTSGLVSGHSVTDITLKASTTAVTNNGTISPSAATVKNASGTDVTSNYDITYNTGTLTINESYTTNPGSGGECQHTFSGICGNKTLTCNGKWNGWTNQDCANKDGPNNANYHKCRVACSYTCNGSVTQLSGDYIADGQTAEACCTYANKAACTGSDPNGLWNCKLSNLCWVHSGSSPVSCNSGYYICGSSCCKNTTKSTTKSSGGGGGGCFPAGTKVTTMDGYKDIDKLKLGDMVLSYNEETGVNEYHEVVYLFRYEPSDIDEELYTLTFDDKNTLNVTSSHKFYIKTADGYEILEAKDIKVDDYVMYADYTYHKVTKIKHKKLKESVYNISVENTHNFYIDSEQILVHNVGIKKFKSSVNVPK